jgi:Fe-S-cluster containining protein
MIFECKRCGWCCEYIKIPIFPALLLKTKYMQDWLQARRITVVKGWVVIHSPCQYLDYDKDWKAICVINEHKPKKCKNAVCEKLSLEEND